MWHRCELVLHRGIVLLSGGSLIYRTQLRIFDEKSLRGTPNCLKRTVCSWKALLIRDLLAKLVTMGMVP